MANQSEKLEQTPAGRGRSFGGARRVARPNYPGQVIDQLIDYAREGPAAGFGRNFAREIRRIRFRSF